MIAAELVDYIKGQLSHGKNQEEVKSTLLSQGWNETDINLALSQSAVFPRVISQSSLNVEVITPTQTEKSKNIFDFKQMKWYEWLAMLPAFFLLVQGGAKEQQLVFLGGVFAKK